MNDPLAGWVAALAIRFNVHPTVVTLTNMVLAVVGSAVVIFRADHLWSPWLPGLAAFVLWQLSYTLDCADGQVARVTGKASSFGARTDVLVDFLTNSLIITALMTVIAQQVDVPVALLVLGGVMWPLSLLVYLLVRLDGNRGHSFTQRQSGVITVVKLVRDDGFILLVVGAWLFVDPMTVVLPVAVFCGTQFLFLLASIGREAYLSVRIGPDPDRASTGATS
ncbi:MAG: CDP-alcohol phosphatidyltransferase family protein [Dehalococcoidia bacterium]